ncbi:unnamed protein product [Polarella glacialis]|uniref:Uncharacterized protein n=1 Tax=Polarella glacialis TaxID=89957 RepID=A0A813J092_POLGL|nr:unnamed protein product [Polarella glacialis]
MRNLLASFKDASKFFLGEGDWGKIRPGRPPVQLAGLLPGPATVATWGPEQQLAAEQAREGGQLLQVPATGPLWPEPKLGFGPLLLLPWTFHTIGSTPLGRSPTEGVVRGCATHGAFAAIKANGSVVTWGDSQRGGDSSAAAALLTEGVVQVGVAQVCGNVGAFVARLSSGSVVTWGDPYFRGRFAIAPPVDTDVVHICPTSIHAFCAFKANGSVLAVPHFGGDSSKVAQHLTEGVVQVCGTNTACAALMIDGSVVTWGDDAEGGDSSGVASLLTEGVVEVYRNYRDFVALKADGSVVFWGDTGSWSHEGDIVSVCGSGGAFAAIRQNGSVVTWGDDDQGGDSSEVAALLTEGVVHICGIEQAFAAIKADGSVVTWGQQVVGGDSSAVAHLLKEGVTAIF